MTLEAIPFGTLVPGGFSRAGQVLIERPDELQPKPSRMEVGPYVNAPSQ